MSQGDGTSVKLAASLKPQRVPAYLMQVHEMAQWGLRDYFASTPDIRVEETEVRGRF